MGNAQMKKDIAELKEKSSGITEIKDEMKVIMSQIKLLNIDDMR